MLELLCVLLIHIETSSTSSTFSWIPVVVHKHTIQSSRWNWSIAKFTGP